VRLYLCRHAEAVDSAGDPPNDEERWLTDHGRQQAISVGRALHGQGIGFDQILTSRLVRAVQTAEGIAFALHQNRVIAVHRDLAPGGRLGKLLADLESLATPGSSVALVGHEPQMSEWGAKLLGRQALPLAFKKGAVLCIDWDGAPELGTGRGVFFLTPKTLRLDPI
jgi:phosphohistidine phosphatase